MRITRTLASLLMFAIVLSFSGGALAQAGKPVDKQPAPGNGQMDPGADLVTPNLEPRQVVKGAFKKMCEMKSFRTVKVNQLPALGTVIVRISEFDGPDRRRSIRVIGGVGTDETITIGPRTYRRLAGPWTESKDPLHWMENAELGIKCNSDKDLDTLPADIKLIGPDAVYDKKVLLYESYLVTWRIGVKDGLFYRIDSKVVGSPKDPVIVTTTYFSDYNAEIKIEPPGLDRLPALEQN